MGALVLSEAGTVLAVEGDRFAVRRGRSVTRWVRQQEVDRVLVLGPLDVTGRAVNACLRRGIDLVFLDGHGRYRGRLAGPASKNAPLRAAQARAAIDPARILALARCFVAGKIENQRRLLLRAQRTLADTAIAEALGRFRGLERRLAPAVDLDVLRGIEGQAAALYFGVFGRLIVAPGFGFSGRRRRPPPDPINACLSFGYTLLGIEMEQQVAAAGLDPLLGFLHEPAYGRASLALDLIEELRPVIVDQVVLRLVNRRQLTPVDFEIAPAPGEPLLDEPPVVTVAGEQPNWEADEPLDYGAPPGLALGTGIEAVHLTETGRRVFLAELFRRLREEILYPPRGGRYSLRQLVREQVYHLVRVIEGRDPTYIPFVPR
jgi:CRISPR-associated protein Cas1